jgi:phosphoribosyl-AMP cyclohydrolase
MSMPRIPTRPVLALVFALALPLGCDDEKESSGESKAAEPATVEKIEGKVTVAGKEAKVSTCKTMPKKQGTALELTLDTGITVIQDQMEGMQWRKGEGAAERLECDRMQSQLSAGKAGAGAWSTGKVGFTCKHADGEIVLDLTIDCGAVDRPSNKKT